MFPRSESFNGRLTHRLGRDRRLARSWSGLAAADIRVRRGPRSKMLRATQPDRPHKVRAVHSMRARRKAFQDLGTQPLTTDPNGSLKSEMNSVVPQLFIEEASRPGLQILGELQDLQ